MFAAKNEKPPAEASSQSKLRPTQTPRTVEAKQLVRHERRRPAAETAPNPCWGLASLPTVGVAEVLPGETGKAPDAVETIGEKRIFWVGQIGPELVKREIAHPEAPAQGRSGGSLGRLRPP
jgi:hypothetical protein